MTEAEIIGWHHQLDGHEFEQTPEDGEGQGSLVCCSPRGRNELDTTERLNNNSPVQLKTWQWEAYLQRNPDLGPTGSLSPLLHPSVISHKGFFL